jgi:hypothetical protein
MDSDGEYGRGRDSRSVLQPCLKFFDFKLKRPPDRHWHSSGSESSGVQPMSVVRFNNVAHSCSKWRPQLGPLRPSLRSSTFVVRTARWTRTPGDPS